MQQTSESTGRSWLQASQILFALNFLECAKPLARTRALLR